MSVATLCFISRDSLELHFEGACYGPLSHTQSLGTLLFALQPDQVDLAASGPDFESALKQVLAAAAETASVLEMWADSLETTAATDVSPDKLATWMHACWRSAPAAETVALQSKLTARLGKDSWGRQTLH
jgi:hypothetical protein